MKAALKSLRSLTGASSAPSDAPPLTLIADDNRPIELNLGGVKLVYSAEEKRWRSDTSQMFQAAEELHRLLDENEALTSRLDEAQRVEGDERVAKETAQTELLAERRKNQRLESELSTLKAELDTAFETIAKLKKHILDPAVPLTPAPLPRHN